MGRHAYLIMAHNEFEILEKLVQLLDYEENDIYLHIDKKVKDFPKERIDKAVKKSKLVYFPSMEINWGGYSQIACEMMMFQYMTEQVEETYQYYHLISGVDLPLKSQQQIHHYFDTHNGKEFVHIGTQCTDDASYLYRIKYYYPFQEKMGLARAKGKSLCFYHMAASLFVRLQKIIGVNRCKGKQVYMGANWLNITYDCLRYIVSKKEEIHQQYKNTSCADELFVQTLLMNSPFADRIHKEHIRYIDWGRGNPYVFRKEDYEELMASPHLWARKFDTRVDAEIVEMIFSTLKEHVPQ